MRLDSQRLLDVALREFSPDWEAVSECSPVDLSDPSQWPSGSRSFQVTLRHRTTGAQKALGRRTAGDAEAGCHRGLASLVLQAYGERNTDPIRRYFDEIGIAAPTRVPTSSESDRVAGANVQQDGPTSGPWVPILEQVRADQGRWLVIVQRHQPALYRHVRRELADIERARVIIDRRFGSRRRGNGTYRTERRRTPHDRRAQHEIDAELRIRGIVFVRLTSTAAPVTPVQRSQALAAAADERRAPGSWTRLRARLLRG